MSTAPVCPPMCPPVWQGSAAALVAELGALETRLHSTWAQMLSVIAEIDSRGTAQAEPDLAVAGLIALVGNAGAPDNVACVVADVLPAVSRIIPAAAPEPS